MGKRRQALSMQEAERIALALPEQTRLAVAAWTLDRLWQMTKIRGTYRVLVYRSLGFQRAE